MEGFLLCRLGHRSQSCQRSIHKKDAHQEESGIHHGERWDLLAPKGGVEAPLHVAGDVPDGLWLDIWKCRRLLEYKRYCNPSLFLHPWICPDAIWESKGKRCEVNTIHPISTSQPSPWKEEKELRCKHNVKRERRTMSCSWEKVWEPCAEGKDSLDSSRNCSSVI